MRASGRSALIGRNARPVSRIARAATICSTRFSMTIATSTSRGCSNACSSCARVERTRGELGEGDRLRVGEHGDRVGRGRRGGKHGVVQAVVGDRAGRGIHTGEKRAVRRRDERAVGGLPRRV